MESLLWVIIDVLDYVAFYEKVMIFKGQVNHSSNHYKNLMTKSMIHPTKKTKKTRNI